MTVKTPNTDTADSDTSPGFGFVNTMNFIDSLTLLFLTLSAVKSANVPREAERGPHDVIPLMEVYNKSLCKPRELLVEILQEYPEEVEHIFIPSCVVLTRCAGCCNDETLQCTPTSSYNVTMEIKRIKTQRQQNDIFMSFTEHSACECRLKKEVKELKEKNSRPPGNRAKGQKRKRKKKPDITIGDAYVSSAFSTYLHLSVVLLLIKLVWEELLCPF
uniref:vascular endothelial growth factor Ab isoform X1 n=1 Tax=Doryrhamphus excisus TaxID=161450 RepID=UPI0025ADC1F1|nr:vascular endothelial growth factor Ab isoform X1 [Doryrhamphus excisus]XP_057913274.1 vascular endothelial growth factor Ab isoform X1 [Doryrhamphus excisus]XP_057913275.1 vascular endothelial growth factor Ab isoform X1 [Doryrhamphus excisus]